jgi:hypothetical protein
MGPVIGGSEQILGLRQQFHEECRRVYYEDDKTELEWKWMEELAYLMID